MVVRRRRTPRSEPVPYNVDPMLVPAGENFRLTNVVTFFGTKGDCWTLDPAQMRRGGLTDFASVPRVGVWLVPKFGKLTPAALWHDWACENGIRDGLVSPRDTDAIFRSLMRRDGVPPLLRNIAWCGVRWGAAANPIRRHEWWSDFPRVFLLTLVALPLMLLAAIGILIGLFAYHVLETICAIAINEVPDSDAGVTT